MLHEINKSGNVSIDSIVRQLSNSIKKKNVIIDIPVATVLQKRDMAKVVPHIWELGGMNDNKSVAVVVGDKDGGMVGDFVVHIPNTKPNGKHALVPVEVGSKVAIGKKEDGMTHVYLFEIQSFTSGDKYGFSPDKMKSFAVASMMNLGALTASWNFPDGIRTYPSEYNDIVEACFTKLNTRKCNMSLYTERWSNLVVGHKKYTQMFVAPLEDDIPEGTIIKETDIEHLQEELEKYCHKSNNRPYRPFSVKCSVGENGTLALDYYPLSLPILHDSKSNRKKKGQLKEPVSIIGDPHRITIGSSEEFLKIPKAFRNGWKNYTKLLEDVKAAEVQQVRPVVFGVVFKGYIQ